MICANSGDVGYCLAASAQQSLDAETETLVAHALRGAGFDASEDGTGRGTPLVPVAFQVGMAVRRLTPNECHRLQGFPDDFCNIPWRGKDHAPDGHQYKAIGNSMAVNVMDWIGQRIQMVEGL